jgi:hypothetical protein
MTVKEPAGSGVVDRQAGTVLSCYWTMIVPTIPAWSVQ